MRDIQLVFVSNRTTSRLLKILSVFERDRSITIRELANDMSVTERTVANDIKEIRTYFGESITLTSGNSGIVFEEKNKKTYQARKHQLLENEPLFEIIGDIFYGKLSRVDELAERYHFSETSFRRLLNKCNPVLTSYGLEWKSNPLDIHGNEASLRKFFKDFYYEGVETEYKLSPETELHELILTQLNGKLGHYEIGSGTTPAAYHYTLFIAIKRVEKGNIITLPQQLKKLAYTEADFSTLYSLQAGIEELYNVRLPKEEFAWIYLEAICKRTLDREDQEQRFYDHFHQDEEIAQLTEQFLKTRHIKADNYKTIEIFIRSFFLSRKINMLMSPTLNKEMDDLKDAVKCSDLETYENNFQFLNEYGKNLFPPSDYLEDICVSLTLYSALIFDFYSPAKTIYFLLEGDHFICQYVRTRVVQHYGTKHSLTFLPLQSLTKETLNRRYIDLVVTNYSDFVTDYVTQPDYLLMKNVPDQQDWLNLEKKINPYRIQLP